MGSLAIGLVIGATSAIADMLLAIWSLAAFWWIGVWLVFTIVVTMIADEKGRSGFGYFVLALLFSPIVALLAVIAAPDRAREKREKDARERTAADLTSGLAAVSKQLEAVRANTALAAPLPVLGSPPAPQSSGSGRCPNCGKLRNLAKCEFCGDASPVT